MPAWTNPDGTLNFDDAKWKPAFARPTPSQNIVPQQVVPIRNGGSTHQNLNQN
jgi:hypothetical protein